MDLLTAFGLFAIGFTMICYLFDERSRWWTFGFAIGCVMSSAYGFLQGAWPFGVVEAVWTLVALKRWYGRGPVARAKPLC